MEPERRSLVLCVSNDPLDSEPFKKRRMEVKQVTAPVSVADFDEARALVIADRRGEFDLLTASLPHIVQQALDRGLLIFVLLASDLDFAETEARLAVTPFADRVRIKFADALEDVAETIARATAEIGPSVGSAKPTGDLTGLSAESQLLLSRAFHDCETIQVERLDGGKAAECALRVHAWLKASVVGPRPMPFFVKTGQLVEIRNERRNYSVYADHYIPFNLRPNLVAQRCVEGSSRGLLVGNFVEDAVSLVVALRSGQGSTAIFSLFENTLRGFRMQPFAHGNVAVTGLDAFLADRAWAVNLRSDVGDLARALGGSMDAMDIQARLAVHTKGLQFRQGPYHGDLHAGNVMTRHRDAILIDFASVGHGPLTADPAALEVSLIFNSSPTNESFDDWRAFVDALYPPNLSLRPPVPEAKPTPFSWLYRAVRELRLVLGGMDGSPVEALAVLAAFLLRYARLLREPVSSPPTPAEKRHAYAIVVAERILSVLDADLAGGGSTA